MQQGSNRTLTFIHSSGDQPYRLLINIEDNVLRVKIGGLWPYRESTNFWRRILSECKANGLDRALVMFQLNKPIEMRDSYAMVSKAVEIFAEQDVHMGVVDLSKRSFVNAKCWDATSATRSFSRRFECPESACEWLESVKQ